MLHGGDKGPGGGGEGACVSAFVCEMSLGVNGFISGISFLILFFSFSFLFLRGSSSSAASSEDLEQRHSIVVRGLVERPYSHRKIR
ncbi:hypothetical protein IE53DRAFT_224464 [Violaceomyces palustris]|uniref:Uncharacterized protein n=1 Tax=Violaceomyces palustris TaxID=1673888 RepID=A0ACD0P4F5_9BASI|nr:hypothetical protein IE53DRAFT_224464 [Violaceomyces palustris]